VDGPNLYCYVVQNLWSRFDPDGLFLSALFTAASIAYDTYQVSTGRMSKAEYARSLAVNWAALAADVLTGGMGGGALVKAAAVAQKVNRVVQRADKVVSAVESLNSAAHAAADGDLRGALISGASGVAGIVPSSKSVNKTKAQTSALVEKEQQAAKKTSWTWTSSDRNKAWKEKGTDGRPPERDVLIENKKTGKQSVITEKKELHHETNP
jgi:hypothetical protein